MERAPHIQSVSRNRLGQLVLQAAGRAEPVVDARVARCFPWSAPDRYISFRDKDGKEVVLLETLEELDPDSRAEVEDELRDKVFNPKILRVIDHKDEFGVISITADTDRGRVTFHIRTRDDIRVLSPTRALLRDADGNAYEIEDITTLDPLSRKHLQGYF